MGLAHRRSLVTPCLFPYLFIYLSLFADVVHPEDIPGLCWGWTLALYDLPGPHNVLPADSFAVTSSLMAGYFTLNLHDPVPCSWSCSFSPWVFAHSASLLGKFSPGEHLPAFENLTTKKWDLWTSCLRLSWVLLKNAESWASPQSCWIRIYTLTRS